MVMAPPFYEVVFKSLVMTLFVRKKTVEKGEKEINVHFQTVFFVVESSTR